MRFMTQPNQEALILESDVKLLEKIIINTKPDTCHLLGDALCQSEAEGHSDTIQAKILILDPRSKINRPVYISIELHKSNNPETGYDFSGFIISDNNGRYTIDITHGDIYFEKAGLRNHEVHLKNQDVYSSIVRELTKIFRENS